MNKARTIFFVGKPGCGKGTQAKLLAEKTGWTIISAGEKFRDLATKNTPVGRKVKTENDAGLLQPYWLATYLYLKELFALPDNSPIIFDGFNRKVLEAELVLESLKWLGRSFSIVYIDVSDEEVRHRLNERKKVSGRADDFAPEERLKEYYEHTEKAIEIFRDAEVLIEVNGEQSFENISKEINTALSLS